MTKKRNGWFAPAPPLTPTTALPHWRERKVLARLDAGAVLRCTNGKAYFGMPADSAKKCRHIKAETFAGLVARGLLVQDKHQSTRYVRAQVQTAPRPDIAALHMAAARVPAKHVAEAAA